MKMIYLILSGCLNKVKLDFVTHRNLGGMFEML